MPRAIRGPLFPDTAAMSRDSGTVVPLRRPRAFGRAINPLLSSHLPWRVVLCLTATGSGSSYPPVMSPGGIWRLYPCSFGGCCGALVAIALLFGLSLPLQHFAERLGTTWGGQC